MFFTNKQKTIETQTFDAFYLKQGVRDAVIGPLWLLGFSTMGFGALVRGKELDWLVSPLTSITTFALPGQVILVETHTPALNLLAIWLAVSASAVRFLPMSVVFLASVAPPNLALWKRLILVQTVAITAWVNILAKRDSLNRQQIWPYAVGFAGTMFVGVQPFPVIGYFMGDYIPTPLATAFLLFMPIYFTTLFSADYKNTPRLVALVTGAILGPICFVLSADWGLLIAGVLAGTCGWGFGVWHKTPKFEP